MDKYTCVECRNELTRLEVRAFPGYGSMTANYRGRVCMVDPWVCLKQDCPAYNVLEFYLDPDKKRYAKENLDVMKRAKEYKEKHYTPYFKGYLGYKTEEEKAQENVPKKKKEEPIIVDGELVEESVEPKKRGILSRFLHRKDKEEMHA